MTTAAKSKKRTVVGVSFKKDITELDAQSKRLGLTRAETLKRIWERFGDESVDEVTEDVAAADIEQMIAPLVTALDGCTAAWQARAHERNMIGGNVNQIAKLANILRLRMVEGEDIPEDSIDDLAMATANIKRQLENQRLAEASDEEVTAGARKTIGELRG